MERTSLHEILNSFSKDEIKKFVRFVQSPYYNTSEATTKLIIEISKFYPDFNHKNFNKEYLFEKVYGNVEYNDSLMRKLVSNLIVLSEKFLIAENDESSHLDLLSSLRKKNLYKHFAKKFDSLISNNDTGSINENVFLFSSLAEVENCQFLYETGRYIEYESSLSDIFNYDTLYYFYRLTQSFIRVSHTSKHDPTGREPEMLAIVKAIDFAKLRKELKEAGFIRKETLLHFFDLIELELTKDESLFSKIKNFSIEYSSAHPEESTYIGYIYLFEFINYKIKQGDRQYLFERHEIYTQLEKFSYSSTPEQMTIVLFNNLFFSGIVTGNITFSEHVYKKYLPIIESKCNPGLYKFYRAWLLFKKEKFPDSLKLISTFSTGNLTFNDAILIPYIKRLELQLNYELGFFESALHQLDSSAHFLKDNKKINESQKKSLTKFMKVFRQLVMLKLKGKDFNFIEAKNKFERDVTVSRDWILSKLEEV